MPIWADFLLGVVAGALFGGVVGATLAWDVAVSLGRRRGYQQALDDDANGFGLPIRSGTAIRLRNAYDRSVIARRHGH